MNQENVLRSFCLLVFIQELLRSMPVKLVHRVGEESKGNKRLQVKNIPVLQPRKPIIIKQNTINTH